MPDLLSTPYLQISFRKTIDRIKSRDYTFTTMIGTYKQQRSMHKYIIRRVFIAVVTFFLVSLVIIFCIYFINMPYIVIIDINKLTTSEKEKIIAMGPQLESHYPSFPEYYIHFMGGIFRGDFGGSIMPASYYE